MNELNIYQGISPVAQERFAQPRNYGPLDECNGHARITGPCGDTMEFWLHIQGGRVARIGFTTTGCGPSRAAGSMATELAIGKPRHEAMQIGQANILAALGGLPKESEHCALLASNTLKAAVQDYRDRQEAEPSPQCDECSKSECPSKQQRPQESEQDFQDRRDLERRMCQIGMKLLVMSGKGGVGKSTVAANLAVSLALAGKTVGLLDVDIHGPSIPKLMGLETEHLVVHGREIVPIEIGGNLRVMSIGFLLQSAADAVIWRGPMKYGVIRQFLKDVEWGPLDYLVIDAPPGTGDEPLSVAQLVGQPAGAILVTTPQDLAVADVRRSGETSMKIAIPMADGRLCMHFGHCEQFALVDVDEIAGKPTNTTLVTPPPHEPGLLPRWLHEQGATVIIAGGMGQRANNYSLRVESRF